MLNNSYFTIYNKSLDIFYKNLDFYINKSNEDFLNDYKLVNSKKITGYMLYVREYYKNNTVNTKKEISEKWKEISSEKKKEYKKKAKKKIKH